MLLKGRSFQTPGCYFFIGCYSFFLPVLRCSPVLAEALPYGLLVVGYQPDEVFGISMVKLYYVTDAGFIRVAIGGAVLLMVMNILLVIFLFWNNTRKVERAVWPILHGIDDISHAREIALPEVGELASVNRELNRAGEYIQKKDKARAEGSRRVGSDGN